MPTSIEEIARRARTAARSLAALSGAAKDRALAEVRKKLVERRDRILEANRADLADAEEGIKRGELTGALVKRLSLAGDRFAALLESVDEVVRLPDPVGRALDQSLLDDGHPILRRIKAVARADVLFLTRP